VESHLRGSSTGRSEPDALKTLWRILVRTLTALGLVVVLVTCTPLDRWWAVQLAGPWTDARGDVLIVLTGNILGNGIIGETSYWRSAYTVMAWREGGWRQVIVSGGGGGASLPVGEAIKIFLESGGIPPASIVAEFQSRSTRESAQNLARILPQTPGPPTPGRPQTPGPQTPGRPQTPDAKTPGRPQTPDAKTPGRMVLLTSDYHMYRAVRALRKAGVIVMPRPIPDAIKRAGSWNLRWEVFQDLLIETSKIAYYWSRGWI
jgi:uncharacterized SAM-binding protein YcdF (DUF218 family)